MRPPLPFAAACLLTALQLDPSARADTPNAAPPDWLTRVNAYRASAGLPPVTEQPSLSAAIAQHARYMVAHDVVQHAQNRRRKWATTEGAEAAAASNLAGSHNAFEPDWWAVDLWMQAPFHAVAILDPALREVGFGIYRAADGRKVQTAAGLDVIRGRSRVAPFSPYPIVWPADGASVPLASHTSESPSPLASCRGYAAPAGLPLIVQIGAGAEIPHVTRSAFFEDGRALEHCVFDETTYRNPNRADEQLGRRILAARDAIVLIPRAPLASGKVYRAQLETNGRLIDWVFRVDGAGT